MRIERPLPRGRRSGLKSALLITLLLATLALSTQGQTITPPPIEWQFSYGGDGIETPRFVLQTSDGGYIIGGESRSGPSDQSDRCDQTIANKTSDTFGDADFWVVRLNASGCILWDKSFGGTGFDGVSAIVETADRGFLIGGTSQSGSNGNKTSPSFGSSDVWVVRVDADGNKLWDKSFGGSGADTGLAQDSTGNPNLRAAALGLQELSDGGWMLAGTSSSPPSGNKTAPSRGGNDMWLERLDKDFNVLWDKSYGGTGSDSFHSMVATSDGGLILAGRSTSGVDAEGSKLAENFGRGDIWVLRLDANGNRVWDTSLGGTDEEGEFTRVALTPDGGIVVASSSRSSEGTGNKTSPNFRSADPCGDTFCRWDYWIVRLREDSHLDGSRTVTKLWDKSFGGTDEDRAWGGLAITADGGIIVGGGTRSEGGNGNKTSPFFGTLPVRDGWVVRLDAGGNKLWEESYGGDSGERVESLRQTGDGGFIILAHGDSGPGSGGGNKTTFPFGPSDYWVIKLAPEFAKLNSPRQSSQDIQQNGFRLNFAGGQVNGSYVFEQSANLKDWQPVQTNLFLGPPLEVLDSDAKNLTSQRFYRARLE